MEAPHGRYEYDGPRGGHVPWFLADPPSTTAIDSCKPKLVYLQQR